MIREKLQKKFDNLDDLNLSSNLLIIQQQVLKWCKDRDNKELNKVRDAIVQISFLTNKLQLDRGNYHLAIDEYSMRSIRSIERARRAEQKIEELEKELAILRKQKELGL